jgi:hypothetical protein
VAALVALFHVATENRALALNEVRQNATLLPRWAIAFYKRRTVLSDDIGHFQPMLAHWFGVV